MAGWGGGQWEPAFLTSPGRGAPLAEKPLLVSVSSQSLGVSGRLLGRTRQ